MNLVNLEVLRRLDAYPKTLEEFSQKTICGAAVTLISSIIMIWLLIFEFYAYLTPNITEELFVDTTRSHKLKINLELYIPSISCNCMYEYQIIRCASIKNELIVFFCFFLPN